MLYAIVALLIIILDQWTKYWVAGNIVVNTGVKELIPGWISLVNIHNEGAAFGFLAGKPSVIFVAIAGAFTLFVIIALATKLIRGQLGRWSAIFVMAGGIGNCIDRVLYGYVQDMIKVDFVNFAIFNVADAFITIGCILFILFLLFGGNKRARRRDELEEEEYEEEEEAFEDDDEEEDEPRLSRRERKALARAEKEAEQEAKAAEKASRAKGRQPKYEKDYEDFKARREAAQPAPALQSPPAVNPADPFAEWERAQAAAQPAQSPAPAPAPAPQPAPVQPPVQAPVQAPVQRPAALAPAPAAETFSLEDILNEFK